jgi:hypothetical protein
MTMPPVFEWLYLKNGAVVHALSTFTGTRFVAECGAGAWRTWYGTGSQDEYDKAAELPKCKSCLPKVGASEAGRRRPSGIKRRKD